MTKWKRSNDATDDPPEKPEVPTAERYIGSDSTVEALAPILLANPRGLLSANDELAGWIGPFDRYAGGKGGTDAAHWLSMFNGEGIIVDRKTGNPRTIFVRQAAVCVTGGNSASDSESCVGCGTSGIRTCGPAALGLSPAQGKAVD